MRLAILDLGTTLPPRTSDPSALANWFPVTASPCCFPEDRAKEGAEHASRTLPEKRCKRMHLADRNHTPLSSAGRRATARLASVAWSFARQLRQRTSLASNPARSGAQAT